MTNDLNCDTHQYNSEFSRFEKPAACIAPRNIEKNRQNIITDRRVITLLLERRMLTFKSIPIGKRFQDVNGRLIYQRVRTELEARGASSIYDTKRDRMEPQSISLLLERDRLLFASSPTRGKFQDVSNGLRCQRGRTWLLNARGAFIRHNERPHRTSRVIRLLLEHGRLIFASSQTKRKSEDVSNGLRYQRGRTWLLEARGASDRRATRGGSCSGASREPVFKDAHAPLEYHISILFECRACKYRN